MRFTTTGLSGEKFETYSNFGFRFLSLTQHAMNANSLILLQRAGEVATLVLNRPARLNALDHHMTANLRDAIAQIAVAPGVRVVVLRGNGASFCAGGDVAAMEESRHDLPGFIEKTIEPFHAAILALRRLPMPVVACVQGAAAGGGFSLAMCCDLVIAAASARFVVAYPQLGAPADGGLSFYLTQRLGAMRGLEALTIHGNFDAQRALSLGLINVVVDDAALESTAAQWAGKLLALAPQSLKELKGLVARQSDAALSAHLAHEKAAFLRCAATPEFSARVKAFAQRR
jgi:2-(1,2-epoxy-1,2-dihydrophenyl)acetyl-CoA isomerase